LNKNGAFDSPFCFTPLFAVLRRVYVKSTKFSSETFSQENDGKAVATIDLTSCFVLKNII
jgi:hypothetical protein